MGHSLSRCAFKPGLWKARSRTPVGALGIAAGLLASFGAASASAQTGANYLMVSDGAASKVHFYRVPDMKLTGTLSGVTLASPDDPAGNPLHAGVIVLPDGRLIVNDEGQQRTLAIKLDGQGAPHIVQSVASTLGGEAPWSAVDPSFRYYAVSSNGGGTTGPAPAPGSFQTGTEFLNLIDLKTFKNTRLEIPMRNVGEDLTPLFGGKPLTLFAGVGGGEMRHYPVARLLAGNATPTGSSPMGPNSHGGFSSPKTNKVGITTGPQPPRLGSGTTAIPNPANLGMDVFDIRCSAVCALSSPFTVPWNANRLTLSKGNRVRMLVPGTEVLTPLNVDLTPGIATDWQNVRLDAHFTNLENNRAFRTTVGTGASSRGFPVSATFAVEPVIRPRAAGASDELKIIDLRPSSPGYRKAVRTIKLEQMSKGPVAGVAPTFPDYERRFAAITPNGRYAFVSRGGDGIVDMVTMATGKVTEVKVPTSLSGGGHIDAFQIGARPWDLSGR